MTKQEAIEKAYGGYWEQVKEFVDENGFIDLNSLIQQDQKLANSLVTSISITLYFDKCRPSCLKGIENNNGWVKIESEDQFNELENGYYEWYNINTKRYCKDDLWEFGTFTHYKLILKSEPPLY
jgi:hypothetical protein